MQKKVYFFKYVVANVVLVGALVLAVIFVAPLAGTAVVVEEPVRRGDSGNGVALMFGVGAANTGAVEEILEALDKHNISATFFVSGVWAGENSQALANIHAAGHELGNYGFFNLRHGDMGANRVREEIELTHRVVREMVGVEMRLFTPPLGCFNNNSLETARALGYTTVVGRNTRVDASSSADDIVSGVLNDIVGGDLILLPANAQAATALASIIEGVRALQLEIGAASGVLF